MQKLLVTAVFMAVGAFLVSSVVTAAPSPRASAPTLEFVAETFVDYGVPTHAGNGPHPATESSDFQLTQGGIRWFSGSTEYKVSGPEGVSGGNTAIGNAVATWDGFIVPRSFSHNESTTEINPCTGSANTVQWASIDGSAGVLATASVCRNVATKEIVGFVVTMDSAESWATDGTSGNFDVENVASHEFGHVAGLGHDNPPKSGCLTMYKFAGLGEIQKRTLGLGDKLGMAALYGFVNTDPGSCGS